MGIGGLQLFLFLGIVGKYLGKTGFRIKNLDQYIV